MASRNIRPSSTYEYYDDDDHDYHGQSRNHHHSNPRRDHGDAVYPTHAHHHHVVAQTHAPQQHHEGLVMGYSPRTKQRPLPSSAAVRIPEEDYYYEDDDSGSLQTSSVESADRRQHYSTNSRGQGPLQPSQVHYESGGGSQHRSGGGGSRSSIEPSRVPVVRMSHSQRMIPDHYRDDKDGSEIYVVDSAYTKGNEQDRHGYGNYNNNMTAPSVASTTNKSKTKAGVVIETMSAPNPFCPNTKGLCCLLVLINLGLILVTLGFSIVLQLFEPAFVWYCGILFLIVGFIALISSLIFLVHLCRESRQARGSNGAAQPGELYWTHHWQKRFSLPGAGGNPDSSTIYNTNNETDGRRSAGGGSMPVHHSYRQ